MPAKEPTVTLPASVIDDYIHSIGLMNELLSHFELEGEDLERYSYVKKLVTQSGNRIKEIIDSKT